MSTKDTEGDTLLATMRNAIEAVRKHTFPQLFAVETTDDDGEACLEVRCPVCGGRVGDANLAAVTVDESWCYNSEPDDDTIQNGYIDFDSDIDRDLGETVFYLHNDSHPVGLPDNWKEEWL